MNKRERVPDYHYAAAESRAIIESMADASLEARAALDDLIAQFFVDTATWGLALWEAQLGIETDHSLPLETRRAAIRQQMVADGNTTAEMVRELAETITGYGAKVEENDDYSFSLSFLGEENELTYIDTTELRAIVEQIKPAHLRFVIRALTWGDLEALGLVWQYFDDHPMTWGELESLFRVHGEA